jgi:hypothetical protein
LHRAGYGLRERIGANALEWTRPIIERPLSELGKDLSKADSTLLS